MTPPGSRPQTPTHHWAPIPAPLRDAAFLTKRALWDAFRRSKLTSSDTRKTPDEAVQAARGRRCLRDPLISANSWRMVVSPLS